MLATLARRSPGPQALPAAQPEELWEQPWRALPERTDAQRPVKRVSLPLERQAEPLPAWAREAREPLLYSEWQPAHRQAWRSWKGRSWS